MDIDITIYRCISLHAEARFTSMIKYAVCPMQWWYISQRERERATSFTILSEYAKVSPFLP